MLAAPDWLAPSAPSHVCAWHLLLWTHPAVRPGATTRCEVPRCGPPRADMRCECDASNCQGGCHAHGATARLSLTCAVTSWSSENAPAPSAAGRRAAPLTPACPHPTRAMPQLTGAKQLVSWLLGRSCRSACCGFKRHAEKSLGGGTLVEVFVERGLSQPATGTHPAAASLPSAQVELTETQKTAAPR